MKKMERLGSVEVSFDEKALTTYVSVRGFEFENASCRESAILGMAWARDMLSAQISALQLAPGSVVVGVN
jgi:hypothetical protein